MNAWLISISAASIIIMLLERLISGGSSGIKKTANFALGLIFMVFLISPIINFLK